MIDFNHLVQLTLLLADGDDSTGKIGDLTLPYKTIGAAMDQAAADDLASSLVYVFPGIYPEYELSYGNDTNRGTLYLSPGATIAPPSTVNGWNAPMTAVDQTAKTFTFTGNYADHINTQLKLNKFRVNGGANDGIYTSAGALDSGGDTVVTVLETIPSSNIAGSSISTSMYIFPVGIGFW